MLSRVVSVISGLALSVEYECRRIVGVGSAAERLALELELNVEMGMESKDWAFVYEEDANDEESFR